MKLTETLRVNHNLEHYEQVAGRTEEVIAAVCVLSATYPLLATS